MTETDFRVVRDQTLEKIKDLLRQRQDIDRRMLALRQTLRGIEGYLEVEMDKMRLEPIPLPAELKGLREMGLTEAIKKVIQCSAEQMNAQDVRDKLLSLEYRNLPKSNPMAAIHAVLTRLVKSGHIKPIRIAGTKKPRYTWAYKDKESGMVPLNSLLDTSFLAQTLEPSEGTFRKVIREMAEEQQAREEALKRAMEQMQKKEAFGNFFKVPEAKATDKK